MKRRRQLALTARLAGDRWRHAALYTDGALPDATFRNLPFCESAISTIALPGQGFN